MHPGGKCSECEDSGRGIVIPERWAGLRIINSKNVLVEGVITTQCPTGGIGQHNDTQRKIHQLLRWGDGMNVFASNNVLFDGVFLP
jgi:hypothetical protein